MSPFSNDTDKAKSSFVHNYHSLQLEVYLIFECSEYTTEVAPSPVKLYPVSVAVTRTLKN